MYYKEKVLRVVFTDETAIICNDGKNAVIKYPIKADVFFCISCGRIRRVRSGRPFKEGDWCCGSPITVRKSIYTYLVLSSYPNPPAL